MSHPQIYKPVPTRGKHQPLYTANVEHARTYNRMLQMLRMTGRRDLLVETTASVR